MALRWVESEMAPCLQYSYLGHIQKHIIPRDSLMAQRLGAVLVQNWNEIDFYFQLITHSGINETFWSLRQERKILRKLINPLVS